MKPVFEKRGTFTRFTTVPFVIANVSKLSLLFNSKISKFNYFFYLQVVLGTQENNVF